MKIFVSYRREDSNHVVSPLREHLENAFGHTNVFYDQSAVSLGGDFRGSVVGAIVMSDVILAVIGRGWATVRDARGRLRLEDREDPVPNGDQFRARSKSDTYSRRRRKYAASSRSTSRASRHHHSQWLPSRDWRGIPLLRTGADCASWRSDKPISARRRRPPAASQRRLDVVRRQLADAGRGNDRDYPGWQSSGVARLRDERRHLRGEGLCRKRPGHSGLHQFLGNTG